MRESILSRPAAGAPSSLAGAAARAGRPTIQAMTPGRPAHAVVLFDGTCAFCERSVTFIATRDPAAYFRFGASQNAPAQALLAGFGETRASTRSIILVEDGRLYRKSTAVLRIARRLPVPWSWAAAFLHVPRPLRDAAYDVVAAVRHRLAGRSNACDIPPPEIRQRLISAPLVSTRRNCHGKSCLRARPRYEC